MNGEVTHSPVLSRIHSTGHDDNEGSRRKSFVRRYSVVQSTEEQFKSTDDFRFYGAYSHDRKKLDYSYHVHYQKSRQWLHDSIIEYYLQNGSKANPNNNHLPCEPWLILTAGVQGAGKRFTIDELVKSNKLPILSFVSVDTGKK